MSLLKELRKIIDLNNPWDEARKKLYNTVVIANGKPTLLLELPTDKDYIVGIDLTKEKIVIPITIETLDLFLPESGLYQNTNGDCILLTKQPKRQWLKSFSQTFYSAKNIESNKITLPKTWILDIFNNERKDIVVSKTKRIYYWDIFIGYFDKKGKLICTDSNFKQELIDWNKYVNTNKVT